MFYFRLGSKLCLIEIGIEGGRWIMYREEFCVHTVCYTFDLIIFYIFMLRYGVQKLYNNLNAQRL